MIFHQKNYEDIRRYYSNTIIKLPQLSGDRLWQIVHINPDEVKLIDVDGMEIYIDLKEEYQVEYPLPGRAVYQMKDNAALLYRKPAKQYYRGLHKENTAIIAYSYDGTIVGMGFGLELLQQFVDKPCYQAVNTINLNEGESWALSPFMAVTKTGHILVLHQQIGTALWDKKQVIMSHPLFKSEIKQYFPGWKVIV